MIETTAILYNQDMNVIKEYSESMFLDGRGEFDVQRPHLTPVPSMYPIKVDIKEEL